MMATKKRTTKPKRITRTCIITTQYRDLYFGVIAATDEEVTASKSVSVDECRHIAYWKGPKGGITSLAAEGPGPGSNIGKPVDGVLITGVAHLIPVTPGAAAGFRS
jgi:hypothetical protein